MQVASRRFCFSVGDTLPDLLVLAFQTRPFPPGSWAAAWYRPASSTLDLLHHLAHDNLDVLIVDINTLHPVYALYFLNQVILHGVGAADSQYVMRD